MQALLEAFAKTQEPGDRAEQGYGAIEPGGRHERAFRGGKGMTQGRVGTTQDADSGIESDVGASMKLPMILGCLMIVVLLCTLVAVHMHGQEASSSGDADLHPWSGGNATT